jgi:hypothetical protein
MRPLPEDGKFNMAVTHLVGEGVVRTIGISSKTEGGSGTAVASHLLKCCNFH